MLGILRQFRQNLVHFMNKKQALLSIIHELFWVFDLAEPLYKYVSDTPFDESVIDGLIGLFRSEIETISDEERKSFFRSIMERLESMRQRELIDIKADREEALRLLELIR